MWKKCDPNVSESGTFQLFFTIGSEFQFTEESLGRRRESGHGPCVVISQDTQMLCYSLVNLLNRQHLILSVYLLLHIWKELCYFALHPKDVRLLCDNEMICYIVRQLVTLWYNLHWEITGILIVLTKTSYFYPVTILFDFGKIVKVSFVLCFVWKNILMIQNYIQKTIII